MSICELKYLSQNITDIIVDMDLLGCILSSMEKPSSLKTNVTRKAVSPLIANQKSSSKPEISGKVFKKNKFDKHKTENEKCKGSDCDILDKLQKIQPVKNMKCSYVKPGILTTTMFKESCKLCGKIYTDRIMFNHHKHNHIRNKKSNLHPFDKLGKIRLSNAQGLTVNNTGSDVNSSPKVESIECLTTVSASNVNVKLDQQNKQSYKCPTCNRKFTKKKTFVNHKQNHQLNKKTGKHQNFSRFGEKIT